MGMCKCVFLCPGTSGKVHYAAGRPRPRPVNGTMPVASHITAALQELSIEQLGRCMIDAAAYQQLVKKLLQSSQVSCVNEELKKSNRDVAQSNLEREKEMQEIGNHIAIIKSSEYADAKGLYHEQLQRQQEVVGRLSIPVLREQLQQAAKKVDEESEDYSRRFLSGDISAETFTDEFCKLRMTYYARELKAQAAGQLQ
ncbi:unnamed protein product [Ostreobium quekettii]|uniref:VPS37 C-terminal domain-containing protein n=1 Tax=Ostreobium quekettii TaxID=121088 RepID=A0A8S1IQ29_9CHLO|nr:unnamed protein product [Ostreobium quekettii]|eukprot:evm.model.scf_291.6 EVM.evm.TU.scf_291.6   scf_291:48929-50258(-)